jgi:hypothetical protein
MSEENINKLNNDEKQIVSSMIQDLTNSWLIRLLIQKGVIQLSELNEFYNNLKAIDLQTFKVIHRNIEDAARLEIMHQAYLETVESARDLDTHGLK